jgi:hypothetical protein
MGFGVSGLPFDPQRPPVDPPLGCVDLLLWRCARQVFDDHQPGLDGFCVVCRPHRFYPCPGRELADLGLRSSCAEAGPSRMLTKPNPGRFDARGGVRPWG